MTGISGRPLIASVQSRRLGLATIVAAFVALSLVYSVVNPIFEAPDELWHFLNAKFILDNRALIVQSSNALENPARQEGGQPPLYYFLSAALVSWLPTGNLQDVAVLNFDAQPGKVDTRFNKNVVIHSDTENFPYHGVSLAVHLLRGFSIALAIGTILTTYAIAREIFPESNVIPLGAAAFNAFVPQFVFLSASINNDNLVTLLASLVVLQLIRLSKGRREGHGFLVLGLLVGLLSLTKISGLGLVPLALAVIVGVGVRRCEASVAEKGTLAMLGGVALLGGWWYARNWALYGDPLGLTTFLRSVDRGGAGAPADQFVTNGATLINSFWALFGWSNIVADQQIYWFLDGLLAIGVVGIIYGGVVRVRAGLRAANRLLLIPIAWLGILIIELVGWTSRVGYDVGRLMFPAISAIALLTVLGISKICGRRFSPVALGALLAAMFVIAAVMPIKYIRPTYKQGVQFVAGERSLARPLDATFGDKFKLLGYELSRDAAVPGQTLSVMLYWEALPNIDNGVYRVGLDLVTDDRRKSLSPVADTLAAGNIVQQLKKTGWLLRDTYELQVPTDAEVSTYLPVVVRVERLSKGMLDAYDGLMRPIGHDVVVTRIRIDPGG